MVFIMQYSFQYSLRYQHIIIISTKYQAKSRIEPPRSPARACRPQGHFRRPELPFPMMVIIIFLLISLVFRNVRNRYRGPLMIDGAFRALSTASAFFTTTSGG